MIISFIVGYLNKHVGSFIIVILTYLLTLFVGHIPYINIIITPTISLLLIWFSIIYAFKLSIMYSYATIFCSIVIMLGAIFIEQVDKADMFADFAYYISIILVIRYLIKSHYGKE